MKKQNEIVGDLSDNSFNLAIDLVCYLCEAVEEDIGRKMTAQEFSDVLAEGLRFSPMGTFGDIDPRQVKNVTIKTGPKLRKVPYSPGAVFAVPRSDGRFGFVIHICTNEFGIAFGMFRDIGEEPRLDEKPNVREGQKIVYSEDELIHSGRWVHAGRRTDLLELFSDCPEILHEPAEGEEELARPFGIAESPTGDIRELSKNEAKQAGLLDGFYFQFLMSGQVEKVLETGII